MNIKEIAYQIASVNMKNKCSPAELEEFAEALVAELAKENKPVAWMYEYSYDLNGDKQGHWPVEMYTHVSFSRSKPSVESTPLYTLPPTAEQIEQETAEALRKDAMPEGWVLCTNKLPPDETPVLILINGELRIGERRWEYPSFEESYKAFWYWDDPADDGQEWDNNDVTHWTPLPAAPKQGK